MPKNNIGGIEIGLLTVDFSNERVNVKDSKIFSTEGREFDTVIPVYPGNERPAKVNSKIKKTDATKKKATTVAKKKTTKKEQKEDESR